MLTWFIRQRIFIYYGYKSFLNTFKYRAQLVYRGAFHSTKYSVLKFRVFPAMNGTVIFRFVRLTNPRDRVPSFARKYEIKRRTISYLCLLALALLNDAEVKINDVLGKGDNIPFIVRI